MQHLIVGASINEPLVCVEGLLIRAQVERRVGQPHDLLVIMPLFLGRHGTRPTFHPLIFASWPSLPTTGLLLVKENLALKLNQRERAGVVTRVEERLHIRNGVLLLLLVFGVRAITAEHLAFWWRRWAPRRRHYAATRS